MPLKIVYFDIPGRAETSRLLLTYGKVPFEDKRLSYAEWPEVKPTTPFGQVPILETDGKVLAQSNAIELYCAKLAGLYPEDNWDAGVLHQWLQHMDEMYEPYVATMRLERTEALAKRAEITETIAKAKLKLFDELLSKHQYILGDKLSYADFKWFHLLCTLNSGAVEGIPSTLVAEYPALKAFRNRIASLDPIKQYYAARTDPVGQAYKPDA